MPEIKVRFTAADLMRLNAEAAAAGVTRSELIRNRALSVATCEQGVAELDTLAYHRLVAGAVRHIAGHLPRHLVEQIVIYVISKLSTGRPDPDRPRSNACYQSVA